MLRPEDFRFGIRRLLRSPGATTASVAALALGIGAAVATWSLVTAVILRPIPVEAPDRLFQVEYPGPVANQSIAEHPYSLLTAIRDSQTFEGIAASVTVAGRLGMPVSEQGDVPSNRRVHFVNHDFFATLGIPALRGRVFAEAEDRPGAPPVTVLSNRYWRTVFGADPKILGRTVTVSGTAATIIGILPPGFLGLNLADTPDLYLPLQIIGDIDYGLFRTMDPLRSQVGFFGIVGRLRPGDTVESASSRLNTIPFEGETLGDAYTPLSLVGVNAAAIPEQARASMSQFATLLALTVSLLLLTACLTVGMLLLVRTEDRRDELAVCLALGATRGRLAGGVVAEAGMLCLLGAVFSVPVTIWFFFGVRAFQLPGRIDIESLTLGFDLVAWLAVAICALAVIAVIAFTASLLGVWDTARVPLQARGLATSRVTRRGPRVVLVAGQIAITLVLVTGSGLFTRSLIQALDLNPELDTERIVMANIDLRDDGYSAESAATFIDQLRERLDRNGVIESVGVQRSIGFAQTGVSVLVDDESYELPSTLQYLAVDEGYFSTIGISVTSGRGFAASDAAGAAPVAIVSSSLARMIAGGGSSVGSRVSDWASMRRVMSGQGQPDYLEVVGVASDLISNVDVTEPLAVYLPIAQAPRTAAAGLVLRAVSDPRAAMAEASATVSSIDPRVTLERVITLRDVIAQQMNPQRFGIYVLSALGAIALLLAMLGTYVIANSMIVNRGRELSIRAALGAGRAHLRGLVLRDTIRLVGSGLVVGILLTVMGARLIRSLLYQVQPLDPVVLLTVSGSILGLALIVSLRPAVRATSLDLTRALREE